METIRAVTSTPDDKAYAYSLIDAALRTHEALASAGEARLAYITRFKAKKLRRSSPAKSESPSGSSTHVASTPSPPTEEATSSTDSCQPWKTSDLKSASPQLLRRKHLYSSRPTRLDQIDRTSRTTSRTNTRPSLRTARETAPSPLTDKAHKKTESDKEE
jgi:hypothetical protein